MYAHPLTRIYRRFSRWVSFGPYNLTDSSGNNAAWIVKQGPEGEYLWAKTVTMSTASNAIVRGLRTDKDGNIYLVSQGMNKPHTRISLTSCVTHRFPQVMDAAGTATIGGMSETVAGTVLVAKLSPSGQPTWLESLGGKYMGRMSTMSRIGCIVRISRQRLV